MKGYREKSMYCMITFMWMPKIDKLISHDKVQNNSCHEEGRVFDWG